MTSMMGGALLVQWKSPGVKLTSLLQHFASGVVTSAVAAELLPEVMSPALDTTSEYWAMIAGFVVGVMVMLVVSRVSEYMVQRSEERASKEAAAAARSEPRFLEAIVVNDDAGRTGEKTPLLPDDTSPDTSPSGSPSTSPSPSPSDSPTLEQQAAPNAAWNSESNNAIIDAMRASIDAKENGVLRSVSRLPWGILVPVMTDASMDGLLIGITFMAGSLSAGAVVALALTIEMCFLGISLSTLMRKRGTPAWLAVPICIFVPMLIPAAGFSGVTVLAYISGTLEIAVLAFGMAALLYLVSDELLVEAHKEEEADQWWVTMFFFIGFGLVLVLQKYTDDKEDKLSVMVSG
eukprot:TRINITY_DN18372_c0_g1_i1.p1 TRINITY_DN18372_c0_g1~~TRINITY_DN18372_c0_g1_i1.p1  ORF type:complete len:397 (-),score=81.47 TRINITY_DN18372_c0_g1_i1:60-1103(-)